MSKLYIDEIIKLNKNLVLITLSEHGSDFIDDKSIKYLIQQSSLLDIEVSKNKKLISILNKKKIKFNGLLSNDYVIIKKHLISLVFILSEIDLLRKKKDKLIIAIDGNAASGKTTLSNILKEVYDCNVFHIDDFFQKAIVDQNDINSRYGSNINFVKIKNNVLNKIQNEDDILYEQLDLSTHQYQKAVNISYNKINIIEGAFSMHPQLINYYDLKIFIKLNYMSQLIRIKKRNGMKKLFEFIKKWIPNENKYFKDLDIINQADIAIVIK
ncbi:MAG: deoxynucleoside kinase [Tenericutes bacterium]|nr:deoxynucleoside kinase [Mycoplasmatota bacterium]